MNFYKHHIGDYAQATGHLSFVEDAAFSRLLRKYYAEEKPIPLDLKAAQRLVGARTREEKSAVETVLNEFFTRETDGWHNKRADEELGKANAQAETNRRIAEDREAKRRKAREEKTPKQGEHEPLHDSLHEASNESCSLEKHESLPSREPSQTPDTRHQTKASTPDRSQSAEGSLSQANTPPRALSPTLAGECCVAARRGGLMQTNPSHPALLAAIAEGATPEQFQHTAKEAVEQGKGFAWVIATVRGRNADATRQPITTGAPHATPRRASAVDRIEANIRAGREADARAGTAGTVIDGEAKRLAG